MFSVFLSVLGLAIYIQKAVRDSLDFWIQQWRDGRTYCAVPADWVVVLSAGLVCHAVTLLVCVTSSRPPCWAVCCF